MKRYFILSLLFLTNIFIIFSKDDGEKKNTTIAEDFSTLKKSDFIHLQFETRFDYKQNWNGSKLETNKFEAHTFKMLLYGNITDKLSYRFRYRFNRTNAPDNSNFAKAADIAYLQYAFTDKFSIRIGKMLTQFGTFEFDHNPATIYIPTMCNSDVVAYSTGVNLAYKIEKQILNLQIINADQNQFASEKYKNKALAALTLWEGNLFNNLLKTKYGFGIFQHDGGTFYNWITLGTQINVESFTTELDMYKGKRFIDFNDIVGTDIIGEKLVHDLSLSVNFKYRINKIVPQLKLIWDERENRKSNGNYQSKKIQCAFEYFPYHTGTMSNLSFHLVYGYAFTKYNGSFKTSQSAQKNSTVLVGLTWPINVF